MHAIVRPSAETVVLSGSNDFHVGIGCLDEPAAVGWDVSVTLHGAVSTLVMDNHQPVSRSEVMLSAGMLLTILLDSLRMTNPSPTENRSRSMSHEFHLNMSAIDGDVGVGPRPIRTAVSTSIEAKLW